MTDPRRPSVGRPPLDPAAPSVSVNVRLPPHDFDSAQRLARSRGESVPDVLRLGLRRLLADEVDGNCGT